MTTANTTNADGFLAQLKAMTNEELHALGENGQPELRRREAEQMQMLRREQARRDEEARAKANAAADAFVSRAGAREKECRDLVRRIERVGYVDRIDLIHWRRVLLEEIDWWETLRRLEEAGVRQPMHSGAR